MMIDGNEPPEDTLVNDMHNGQATAHMVFSVLHQYLNGFKLFFRDNGGVLVGIEILVSVLPVFSVFVFIQVCGKGFPSQDITAISFVGQDIANRAGIPIRAARFRFYANFFQE